VAVTTMGPSPERGPELDLPQFVNAHADHRKAKDLGSIGPLSLRVSSVIKNEGTTAAMLATNFWRAWLASDGAEKLLRTHGASSVGLDNRRTIIVPRPQLSRFDLVVLDPGLAPDFKPVAIDLSSATSLDKLEFGAHLSVTQDGLRHIWNDAPSLIPEAFNDGKQPYSIVLASSPRFQRLMVPDQPLDVDSATAGQHSTAGAVVEDLTKAGRIGVTAALHGIGSAVTSVTVAGQSGTVVRTSSVTDSAFIELLTKPSCTALSTKGVMSGLAPRGSQTATFIGLTSRKRSTTIVGWDPQVPTPSGYRQACIYTGRDAQAGDSGSALVSDDDWIVGFAFERSLPGQNPVQCSWIWAESVFNALQVKLI
jgi:hypothetical protein